MADQSLQHSGFSVKLTPEARNEIEEVGKRFGGEKGAEWVKLANSSERTIPLSSITEICKEAFGHEKLQEGSEWMT
ncbi:MAG: hypothetical protein EZS28_014829 [Streblomastix strix]|uniref:Uncharacterized protein n=1 Tax=Streblomastix strix TaxID=222440 RepID=A0A5J4W4R8_9EUKA|nr:MAG: hypothetical protein EZS28_014829 [Streblomastix strix]